MERIFYRSGKWCVTDEWVRTAYRDFRVANISAVELSRFPLVAAAAVSTGVVGVVLMLSPVIYPHEKLILLVLCAAGIAATSQVGWLHLKAADWRGTDTGRVIGPLWRLRAVREAIHEAQSAMQASQSEK